MWALKKIGFDLREAALDERMNSDDASLVSVDEQDLVKLQKGILYANKPDGVIPGWVVRGPI